MKSIVEKEPAEVCFLCGACGYLEKHHIFGGNPNRKWSEKYGLTVHLCPECHRDTKKGVHADAEKAEKLHKIGQAAFEKKYGREKFWEVFHRFYIEKAEGEGEKKPSQGREGFVFLDDVPPEWPYREGN